MKLLKAFLITSVIVNIFNKCNAKIIIGDSDKLIGTPKDINITTELVPIAKLFVGLGVAVAIIAIIYLGFKYAISTPSTRADVKKTFIGLCISILVLLGAVGVFTTVGNFFKTLTGT